MPIDVGQILGKRLRAIRKELGGTQEAFSERSGLTQVRISRLERGLGYRLMQEVADGISQAGGDPADLFSGSPPADAVVAEIRRLVLQLDEDAKEHILATLRREIKHQQSRAMAKGFKVS